MHKIKAYDVRPGYSNINPLSAKRDWMDATWNAHAYHCFPVSLASQLGWSISFPEDISFIWDGISDSLSSHVTILKGSKYAYAERANATVSFYTGIRFVTDDDITLLTMPVPNLFNDSYIPFTTLLTTSFFPGELPMAIRILKPNVEITIPANTPIASILPINLNEIQNSSIDFDLMSKMPYSKLHTSEYSETVKKLNQEGKWADFYRNATDHNGEKMGDHQVKSLKLFVNDVVK